MSDNQRYYWLKLKHDFFESEEMIILEGMEDGYIYSNILLKLYLKSLKNEGRLMLKATIPYSSSMLAKVTRHSVGDIEKSMRIFQELGLVEFCDNGAIYMSDIQDFIGTSTTEADRKRKYRNRIKHEQKALDINENESMGHLSGHSSDNRPPEIRDKSKEIRVKSIDYRDEDEDKDKHNLSSSKKNRINQLIQIGMRRTYKNTKIDDYLSNLSEESFSMLLTAIHESTWLSDNLSDSLILNQYKEIIEGKYADYKNKEKSIKTKKPLINLDDYV